MGKQIKRLSLALVALGLSAPVFADSGSPFDVTVPNQQGGFTIGADALYLRPTAGTLTYAATINPIIVNNNTITVSGALANVDPSYSWGFDVMGAYRIAGTGNDISLSWTHLGDADDSDSVSTPINGILIPPPFNSASGNTEFDYDAVDLDVGQRVNFGDYFNFHVFTGVRWAELDQKTNATYGANILINTRLPRILVTTDVNQDSEFKGIGPQFGFDGRACLGYGFGLDAALTASLLVGQVDSSADTQTIVNVNNQQVFALNTSLDSNDRDRVIPAVDGKLGLDYTFNFNNADRSSLVVQAGYEVINYFDVTSNILNGPNSENNVAFDGPYAGVKVNL